MEIILSNKNGAQLGYENGCYYMKYKKIDYFVEIPAYTEEEAWDFFDDHMND